MSVAQEAKLLARNHKNALRPFCKRQSRSLVGACQVLWLRIVGGPGCCHRRQPGSSAQPSVPFAGKNIVMVDDDTLVESWQSFLMDFRTSDAEIRRLSRLAFLRYEDFRLQLIAWSLES